MRKQLLMIKIKMRNVMKSEYDELKTDYINAVKNQKFQNNGSTDNGNDFKSDDEIINEILGL